MILIGKFHSIKFMLLKVDVLLITEITDCSYIGTFNVCPAEAKKSADS